MVKVKPKQQHLQRQYGPLVMMFLAIALLIGAAVYYLAFIKSVVVVQVEPVESTEDFNYSGDELDAPVVETNVTDDSFTYSEFDQTTMVPGMARGKVVIENKYSADQPLVRTTRLLSDTGVLFRTDATVTVPAGGSVEVEVYADQAGETGNIEPTKFEIVALWAGLKDKIYATSTEPMTGGLVSKNTISEADITAAKAAAELALREQAVQALQQVAQTEATGITADSLQLTITEQTTSPASGSQTDQITVQTTAKVTALAFTTEKLLNLLQQQFNQTIQPEDVQYSVTIDSTTSGVSGNVHLTKNLTVSDIDRNQLTGKSKDQIKTYLEQQPGVKAVPLDQIKFSPFWLHALPANSGNKIIIVIQS